MQELHPFRRELAGEKVNSGNVSPRPGYAGDETEFNWVIAGDKDDGNSRGRRLGRERGRVASSRGDHGNASGDQFFRKLRQAIVLPFSPAVLDDHVLPLDKAGIPEAVAEPTQTVLQPLWRSLVEKSEHRHRLLLRARPTRPCGCRPAEQRDEFASFHGITSSACR